MAADEEKELCCFIDIFNTHVLILLYSCIYYDHSTLKGKVTNGSI